MLYSALSFERRSGDDYATCVLVYEEELANPVPEVNTLIANRFIAMLYIRRPFPIQGLYRE